MSHPVNTTILERHFEDALDLTRNELLAELGVSLPEQFTAFHSNDDLAEAVAQKRFEEGPDGPC